MTLPRTEQMPSVGETGAGLFLPDDERGETGNSREHAVIPNWISMASSRKPRHTLLPNTSAMETGPRATV